MEGGTPNRNQPPAGSSTDSSMRQRQRACLAWRTHRHSPRPRCLNGASSDAHHVQYFSGRRHRYPRTNANVGRVMQVDDPWHGVISRTFHRMRVRVRVRRSNTLCSFF